MLQMNGDSQNRFMTCTWCVRFICAAVSMKADGFQVPAGVKKAMAPAIAALSVAAPAFAEGTGEVRLQVCSPISDGRVALCTRALSKCGLVCGSSAAEQA